MKNYVNKLFGITIILFFLEIVVTFILLKLGIIFPLSVKLILTLSFILTGLLVVFFGQKTTNNDKKLKKEGYVFE